MNNFQKIRFVAFTMLLAILMLTFNACTKQEIIKNPEPQFIQTPSATDSIHETRGGAEEFVAAVLVIAIKKFAGMQSVQWFFGGMNHTDWYVKYEKGGDNKKGLVVWNDFRSYRTSIEVKNYFTLGQGDCDAWWWHNGIRKYVCYDSKAKVKYFKDNYGRIIDMGFKKDGKLHSIFNMVK